MPGTRDAARSRLPIRLVSQRPAPPAPQGLRLRPPNPNIRQVHAIRAINGGLTHISALARSSGESAANWAALHDKRGRHALAQA